MSDETKNLPLTKSEGEALDLALREAIADAEYDIEQEPYEGTLARQTAINNLRDREEIRARLRTLFRGLGPEEDEEEETEPYKSLNTSLPHGSPMRNLRACGCGPCMAALGRMAAGEIKFIQMPPLPNDLLNNIRDDLEKSMLKSMIFGSDLFDAKRLFMGVDPGVGPRPMLPGYPAVSEMIQPMTPRTPTTCPQCKVSLIGGLCPTCQVCHDPLCGCTAKKPGGPLSGAALSAAGRLAIAQELLSDKDPVTGESRTPAITPEQARELLGGPAKEPCVCFGSRSIKCRADHGGGK